MADNVPITQGDGTEVVAADEIAGAKYQRIKLIYGDNGTNSGDVSTANPLPVTGTVAVTGSATAAKQDTGNTSLASIDSKITAVNTGAVVISSGSVTADTELPSAAALSDSDSSTPSVPTVGAFLMAANAGATSSNRVRTMGNGADTTGTGILAAGLMGQYDDSSPGTVTENRFGNIRMSVRREVYQQIRDAAGNERGANVTAGGALVVDGSGSTQPVSYATTGSGTATGAIRVELPTNGTGVVGLNAGTAAIGKLTQPATPTLTNVTMTGSSVTLQASNTARRNLMIFNDSGVVVYVKLGSTASSSSFTVKMVDQSYYELPDPVYTGIVTALGASGSVRVTEVV